MTVSAHQVLRPRGPNIERLGANRAKVVIEPLERGYGHTLGNALRRVLLSSIPGFAITEVEIDGVLHEYTTVEGLQEDVLEVLLNLKDVAIRMHTAEHTTLTLQTKGPGVVTAAGQPPGVPQPLLGGPDLSALPALLERVPLRFAWSAQPHAQGWRAQVLDATELPQLRLDGRFGTPAARWVDLPDGRYLLRVRAVDAAGLEGSDSHHAFTLKARPEPPVTSQPVQEAKVYGTEVTFAWATSSAAASYRIQVAGSADFAAPALDLRDLRVASHVAVLPPGPYHWRVASVAAGGDQGPYSDPAAFVLRPVPPSPALEPPQPGPEGLLLRWRMPESGQHVQLQLAADPAFGTVLLDQRIDAAQLLLPKLAPGSYHLRMRTITADGFEGNFGQTQQIQIEDRRSNWWLIVPALLLVVLL